MLIENIILFLIVSTLVLALVLDVVLKKGKIKLIAHFLVVRFALILICTVYFALIWFESPDASFGAKIFASFVPLLVYIIKNFIFPRIFAALDKEVSKQKIIDNLPKN